MRRKIKRNIRKAANPPKSKHSLLGSFCTGMIIFFAIHVIYGVDYIRGKDAKWVTMHIDSVSTSNGRSTMYYLHLGYQDRTFKESVGKRTYEHYKTLDEIRMLTIPDTKWIAFDEEQKWREWKGMIWITIGLVIFQLFFVKELMKEIREKIYREPKIV